VFLFGLPFLFLPLAWYLWANKVGTLLYEELLQQTVVAGVIGAVISIPSLVGLFSSKSRKVRLDWGPRTISIREGSRTQVIPMADVAAIEFDCRHQTEGGGGGGIGTHSNNVVIHRYHCVVRLHRRNAGLRDAGRDPRGGRARCAIPAGDPPGHRAGASPGSRAARHGLRRPSRAGTGG
jgi:hypothetical protein